MFYITYVHVKNYFVYCNFDAKLMFEFCALLTYEKRPQINFSCQNFSVENSYFFIFCQIFDIFDDIFFSEPLSLSILEIQLEMSCPGPTLNPLSNLLLKRNYLYLPMKYIKTMFMLMDVNFTLSKRYI